jgi:hypothetical protein
MSTPSPPPQQYGQQQYSPPPPQQYNAPQQFSNQPQHDPHQTGPVQPGQGGYRGKHPAAAFFQLIFKLTAALVYLFGTLFGGSFIGVFIAVVLLLAADFWTVKNVTGRLMVRLRWWNRISEDGVSEWVFESHPDATSVDGFDSYFFWVTTYGAVVVWMAFLVFTLMSPTNIPLTALGAILNGANALGYTKCRRDAKQKLTQFVLQNPGMMAHAARAM